jgi:hypothetical protein
MFFYIFSGGDHAVENILDLYSFGKLGRPEMFPRKRTKPRKAVLYKSEKHMEY